MDVFISYKSEDFHEANRVRITLESEGISCWMAPMSLPGGSSYAVEIPQAIRSAQCFVLILSERCQTSKWVPREVDQAIQAEKVILPFMLENCVLKDDFSFYLTNVQRYAAYEDRDEAVRALIARIRSVVWKSEPEPEPEPEPETAAPEAGEAAPAPDDGVKAQEKDAPPQPTEQKPRNKDEDKPRAKRERARSGKPKKKRAEAKGAEGSRKKKRRKRRIITAAVLAGLVLCIILLGKCASGDTVFDGALFGDTIEIAGKTVERDETYVSLRDCTLTSKDVRAMQSMENLRALYLVGCSFSDEELAPVVQRMEYIVELSDCALTTERIHALGLAKTAATSLKLDNNEQLSDLRELAACKGTLRTLSFNGCCVEDISFLKDFTELTSLEASDNKITDISALGSCGELKYLRLGGNAVQSLEPLASCGNLEELNMNGNAIQSLEPLASCEKLKRIYVANNALEDLSGLETAIYLTEIDAHGNDLTDLDPLQNATLLTKVDFSGCSLYWIKPLSKSADTLTTVRLSDNRLTNISALTDCKKIKELYVDGNELTQLDPLQGHVDLETLVASDNEIFYIDGLAECVNLREVYLSHNNITKTDALQFQTTGSVSLDLSHNQITKLRLPEVQYIRLWVFGNPVANYASLYSVSFGNLVLDYDAKIEFAALQESAPRAYITIFDCPLDRRVELETIFGKSFVTFTSEADFLAQE